MLDEKVLVLILEVFTQNTFGTRIETYKYFMFLVLPNTVGTYKYFWYLQRDLQVFLGDSL